MLTLLTLLPSLLGAALSTAPAAHSGAPVCVTVAVDSVRHEVTVTAGPFDLKPMAPEMSDMADMPDMPGMEHGEGHHAYSDLMRFDWPVGGYMTGFDIDLRDAAGQPLPRETLHHMIGVNFDRRQLVYPAFERTFGWGTETNKVVLPAGVGVPLARGERLSFYVAWHNGTGHDIAGAQLRLKFTYAAGRRIKVPVLPLWADVSNVVENQVAFELPKGRSAQSWTFTVPVSGRVIAVGGHLHDYGMSVRLEDAESGKVLVRLKAKRDSAGHVLSVSRFVFGFHEDALPLVTGHRYRVVSEYDNTSGHVVPAGGMGHINGAFQPDDLAAWPTFDPNGPDAKKDLAGLPHLSAAGCGDAAAAEHP